MNPLYVYPQIETHFQVNIIGVMTGTEIALERMKKVSENVGGKRNKKYIFLAIFFCLEN